MSAMSVELPGGCSWWPCCTVTKSNTASNINNIDIVDQYSSLPGTLWVRPDLLLKCRQGLSRLEDRLQDCVHLSCFSV